MRTQHPPIEIQFQSIKSHITSLISASASYSSESSPNDLALVFWIPGLAMPIGLLPAYALGVSAQNVARSRSLN